jgi:hypothetical protein
MGSSRRGEWLLQPAERKSEVKGVFHSSLKRAERVSAARTYIVNGVRT